MSRRSSFAQDVISRQERMLRLAERDYDLSLRVLEAETGIPKETLSTYKHDTAMPAWTLVALARVIPDDLTSLMFEPIGKHVGTDETGEGDLDALEVEASGVVHEIAKAKRDKVVTPQERAKIAGLTRRMIPTARAVAA